MQSGESLLLRSGINPLLRPLNNRRMLTMVNPEIVVSDPPRIRIPSPTPLLVDFSSLQPHIDSITGGAVMCSAAYGGNDDEELEVAKNQCCTIM